MALMVRKAICKSILQDGVYADSLCLQAYVLMTGHNVQLFFGSNNVDGFLTLQRRTIKEDGAPEGPDREKPEDGKEDGAPEGPDREKPPVTLPV